MASLSFSLWLLYEDELDAWRAAQSAPVAEWLGGQNFKAEKHRVLLVPDRAGAIALAVGGLGKRQGGRLTVARRRTCRASAARAATGWRKHGAQAMPRKSLSDLPTRRTASSDTAR